MMDGHESGVRTDKNEQQTSVLKALFEQHFRLPVGRVQPVQGQLGGSGRTILRLASKDRSAIGVLHDVREENLAFVEFSRHFRARGLPVPEIYAEDLGQGAYLIEDLGDTTLFGFLSNHRVGMHPITEAVEACHKAIAVLPRFQIEASRDLDYKLCYPRAAFDAQSIAWDLNYFKYYFLKLAGIPFSEQSLEDDFGRLTCFLLSADSTYFLYRDFQTRNIMLRDGNPFFLDYQGGRKGALQYDIAAFLYDAKADLPPELRQQLLDCYLVRVADFIRLDREAFMRHFYAYVYIRIMQAMGAYGFRGFYERKTHFLESVPFALKNVRWLLQNVELPVALPTLMGVFTKMVASEKLQRLNSKQDLLPAEDKCLVIRIYSFSYHRGVPKDQTGHGGGFVFDARSIPNPGRQEKFKSLTGTDTSVIDFLNHQEGARQFLASTMALVDASISAYQRRGFTSLTVSFGCTGGQHRSVYFADQMAKRLGGRKGLKVLLRHLELENRNR